MCVGDLVFSSSEATDLSTVDVRVTVTAHGANNSLDIRGNSVIDTGVVNITLNDIFLSSLTTTIDNTPTTEVLTEASSYTLAAARASAFLIPTPARN